MVTPMTASTARRSAVRCSLVLIMSLWSLSPTQAAPDLNPCAAERGTVIVIGGLGGFDTLTTHTRAAMDHCFLNYEVIHFNWSHGKGRFLVDLVDHHNVAHYSRCLADLIMQIRAEDPQRRICVLAWSGGVGVALGAGELLPPDTLDRIVLMCAACSANYDLRGALRSARGGIVSYYCHLDQFFLTFLTAMCGTIDRVHGPCAGMCGFRVPCCLCAEDADLYCRLQEVRWRPAMIHDGHMGGHLFYKSTRFLSNQIVPWLR